MKNYLIISNEVINLVADEDWMIYFSTFLIIYSNMDNVVDNIYFATDLKDDEELDVAYDK